MRSARPWRLWVLWLAVASAGCAGRAPEETASAARPAGSAAGTYVLVGGNVVPMDRERILAGHSVVVRDGRIAEVAPAGEVNVPDGATVIDATGHYVVPGLAEMHSHLASLHSGQASPELVEQVLLLYLLNGVTTIRGMATAPSHLEIRRRVASGEIAGPTMYLASPSLGRNNAADPEVAARLVAEHAAAGYDLIKIHGWFGEASFHAVMDAARRAGITVGGHVDPEVGVRASVAAGQSTIEHLDGFVQAVVPPEIAERVRRGEMTWEAAHRHVDSDALRGLALAMQQAGVWNVPTLYIGETMANELSGEEIAALHPEIARMPGELRGLWIERIGMYRASEAAGSSTVEGRRHRAERRREFLRALSEAGAPIMAGADSPAPFMVPGYSLHREMRVMAEAGMTPYQVLASATRNPGIYVARDLGRPGTFGRIEPGARADLVMVRNNPLEDVGHLRSPAGVMVRGVWYTAAEIERRLRRLGEVPVHR